MSASDIDPSASINTPMEEIPRAPIRTLYFTAVALFPDYNGGAICCRNHVRRLVSDPRVDLLVCVAGPPREGEPNRQACRVIGS